MEQLADLPPLAIITFGVTVAIIFGVRHLGLWQGSRPVEPAAQVAAVIVDPTALNKATAAVEKHAAEMEKHTDAMGDQAEAVKALMKAVAELAEYMRRAAIETDRLREEVRLQHELRQMMKQNGRSE
jgi:hypothetical protein